MSEVYSILDLSKLIKSARENCILGYYQKALNYYQIAIPIIEARIAELSSDTLLQEKWKSIEKGLKEEEQEIREIMKSCDIFKKIYKDGQAKENPKEYPKDSVIKQENNVLNANDILNDVNKIQNISNQVTNQINNIQKNNSNNNNRDNRDRDINKNVYKPESNQPNYGGGRGGGGRVNPMNLINNVISNHPANDRMVKKYGDLANLGPDGHVGGRGGNFQPPRGGGGKGAPSGGKGSKPNANDKNKDGKSSFLLSRYPDGNGPDSELIEMLEREVVDTNPNVSFDDIAELAQAKKALQEAVLLPLIIPDYFKGIRRPWRGVLLYGPPGTGKTMLAKALATQGKTTFFNVHSSSFASKWRGESEKLVRILFEMARFYAPTCIFIDEVDSLCSKRGEGNEGDGSRRVKAELLVQMEGVNSNTSAGANEKSEKDKRKIVAVMGATNRPWDLDEALRRRFEKRVYIPLPNEKGRLQLFQLNLKKISVDANIDYNELVKMTDGYSGADICNVCREASFMPMRRELLANRGRRVEDLVNDQEFRTKIRAPITMADLKKAISNISKSVGTKDLEVFDKWTKEFSSV